MAATATAQKSGRTSTAGRGGAQSQRSRRTSATAERSKKSPAAEHHHDLTVTVPRRVVDIAETPFVIAGRVLPAKKGLPLYVGLGALAVAEAISWPVAVGIGVAYESIRRWGPRAAESKRSQRQGL